MNATRRDPVDGLLGPTASYRQQPAPDSSPPTPRAPHRFAFHTGDRPLDGYTIKRAIGRGGFGEVYYAVSDAGKEVALKLITRNLEIERRGVLHCMNLKSPHLITIFDLKSNEQGDVFVVMEYVSGPSLASILADHPQGLPLPEIRAWLQGLVAGVSYLHDHGIVHRDLKPANLFLEEGVVKIGDYGLSKSVAGSNEAAMSENVGTCHYMAPEISRGKYHKPIDIYAIGVILYEMLTGTPPFEGETAQEVLWKHLTDQPNLSRLPEPYRTTVRRALAKDPNHRPQRPEDLLPPEDAPRVEEIRFLERQASAPVLPEPPAAPEPPQPKEDVLVIKDEEPVLYIGPKTQPPRQPRRFPPWSLARDRRAPAQPHLRRRPAPAAPPAPATVPVRLVLESPARLDPPPLPSPRLRVAELAGSMLVAAPLAALAAALVFPAYRPLDIRLPQDPIQLAYLALMVLLGTWGVLVTTKLWEGRTVARSTRRLLLLGLGLALGATGVLLGDWARLAPTPIQLVGTSPAQAFFPTSRTLDPTLFTGYFGLTFAALGWWKLTARDRAARFQLWPVVKTLLVGGLLGIVIPSPQPWGALVLVLVAILLQLVSPWSREAAAVAAARRVRNAA